MSVGCEGGSRGGGRRHHALLLRLNDSDRCSRVELGMSVTVLDTRRRESRRSLSLTVFYRQSSFQSSSGEEGGGICRFFFTPGWPQQAVDSLPAARHIAVCR